MAVMGSHACGGFREFLHCRHSDIFREFFQLVSRKRFEEAELNGKTFFIDARLKISGIDSLGQVETVTCVPSNEATCR